MAYMHIWEKIRSEPESGAKELVATYSERLYKLAFRLCSNASQAEDLAMRTLARAMRAERDFPSDAAYFSFLCTILVNLHRDDLRLKGANALVFMEDIPEREDERPDPAASLIAKSDAEAVRKAIGQLSPVLREAVVLRYFSELSVADVAEALVVPEGTVKFRLSEARRKIEQILTQRFGFSSRSTEGKEK